MKEKMLWTTLLTFLCLFTGAESICLPSNIRFRNYRQFPKRIIPYYLEVAADKCREYEKLFFEWEVVTDYEERVSGLSSDSAFLNMDGFRVSGIPIFTTILGARIKVSHNSDFSPHVYDIVYFRFQPDRMELYIMGGLKRTYPVGMDLILDGKSGSRDLSFAPDEDGLEGNNVTWEAWPSPPETPPDSYVWVIPSSNFKAGDRYVFTMTVRRTKIVGFEVDEQAFQQVTFLENVPVLEIECISNCLLPHWEHTTAFQVTCTGECDNAKYLWYSEPDILDAGSIEFGDGTPKLLIKPGVPKKGETYVFGAKAVGADVSMALTFMSPLVPGECEINSRTGVAGFTRFEIICDFYRSFYGDVTFFVYQGNPATDEKAVLVAYSTDTRIVNILFAEGEAEVTVVVEDSHFMKEYVAVGQVSISPFETYFGQNKNLVKTVKSIILGSSPQSLKSLLAGNSHDRLTQIASLLLPVIDRLPISKSTKKDLDKHIAITLGEVILGNINVAVQVLSLMWKFIESKEETDTYVTALLGDVMMGTADKLYEYALDKREEFVIITFIIDFGKKLLNLFSELVTQNAELLPHLQSEIPPHEYDSYDEMSSDKIIARLNFANFMFSMLKTMEFVSRSILRKAVTDQMPIEIPSKSVILSVRRVKTLSLLNQTITAGNNASYVFLPEAVILDLASKFEVIDYEFAFFTEHPFWWHIDYDFLNTDIIVFNIWAENRKITTLRSEIDIYLNIIKAVAPEENYINGTLKPNELAVYRVETRARTVLGIEFWGAADVKVLLQDCPPTKSQVKTEGIRTTEFLYSSPEKKEMFLGILNEKDGEVNYRGTVNIYVCVTWDLEKKNFIRGNFATSRLINDTLLCRTSHLSVFGGVIGASPNKIEIPVDLDIALFLHNNLVVVFVLAFIIVLWFFLMVWAVVRDSRLARKNIVFQLADTIPGDDYGYLVVVVTGWQFDAGTTANVVIQLVGDEAESRPHLIKCSAYESLQRGSEDWFVIYSPKQLAQVRAIRLWHDCRGRKPHWYCSRVIVQELKTGKQFCFIVDKWFSLVWGDSEVSREIPVATQEMLTSKKMFFPIILSRHFRDGHLWLSIFSNLPQSNFSTKERVTVAICVLTLTMLASGMFYGIPKGNPSDAIFSQGSYYITLTEVYILVESLLVTIPAAVILVLLFKKSGPPPLYVEPGLPNDLSVYWQQYPFVFGVGICKFRALLSEMVSYTSVLTIVAFSMERYLAICHPLHHYSMSGLKRAIKIIGFVWTVSMASAAPFAVYTTINYLEYPPGTGRLEPESAFCAMLASNIPPNFPIYEISSFFFFFLPMIVILILYLRMGMQIRRRGDGKSLSLEGSVHEKKHSSSRKAIIRMLTAVVVAFFLCWAPFHAQRLLYIYFWDHPNFPLINEWIYHITGILYYVSSTVNPILYNVMSAKYRQAFKETLCGFALRQKPRSPDGARSDDCCTLHSCSSLRSTKSRYYVRPRMRRDSKSGVRGGSEAELACENSNLISNPKNDAVIQDGDVTSGNSLVMMIKPGSGKYEVLSKRGIWHKTFFWVVRPKTVSTLEMTKRNNGAIVELEGDCEIKGHAKTRLTQKNGSHTGESSI